MFSIIFMLDYEICAQYKTKLIFAAVRPAKDALNHIGHAET